MNKYFKSIFTNKPVIEKIKRTLPITAAFTAEGECIGKFDGADSSKAFTIFPNATIVYIIPVKGKSKVIRRD